MSPPKGCGDAEKALIESITLRQFYPIVLRWNSDKGSVCLSNRDDFNRYFGRLGGAGIGPLTAKAALDAITRFVLALISNCNCFVECQREEFAA